MRETADYFGVSLWTALAVYRRLERDGLVVRVRGSQTLLPARPGTASRASARGSVVLMSWLPGFLHTPDQRFVVMQMEKCLWDRGFVSEIVFYHEEDKPDPGFSRRILAHRPDYAVWLMPGPADESTMAAISDAGVRLVVVADQPVRTRTPQYKIDWQKGWRAAMRCWQGEGVTRVVIPTPSFGVRIIRPRHVEVLRELGIPYDFVPFDETETMENYVGRLAVQPSGIVFEYDIWHARVCTQAPRAFARLLAEKRVLQCWPLPIEPGFLKAARADVVLMPWQEIIDRIVGDLSSGRLLSMRHDVNFQAAWQHRAPAASLSRLHAYERV